MQGLLIDIPAKDGEPVNLTLYSDMHLDAKSCCVEQLQAHMKRRAALPNSYFAHLGDVGNWIKHGKDKRFDASVPRPRGLPGAGLGRLLRGPGERRAVSIPAVHPPGAASALEVCVFAAPGFPAETHDGRAFSAEPGRPVDGITT